MTLNQSTFEQGLGQGPLALLVAGCAVLQKKQSKFLVSSKASFFEVRSESNQRD